jgi:A/G-specific adenine glycosylase
MSSDLHAALLRWFDAQARDLPWRRPSATPWGVLVSELMLQQTPVSRVLPVWETWMQRWPTPADLAADPPGAAVRAWGRLGYPRRALRLHACAVTVTRSHGGAVPDRLDQLRALPGVGEYTAAAVLAFAHHRRAVVLDTNVRRVLARVFDGVSGPTAASPVRAERLTAERLLPADDQVAARWSVALMELGALVCTVRDPRCPTCPLKAECRWRAAGRPAGSAVPKRQTYAGTDRQCRGALLAVLRASDVPVSGDQLAEGWADPVQRARALDSLLADGLVERHGPDTFALPGMPQQVRGRGVGTDSDESVAVADGVSRRGR